MTVTPVERAEGMAAISPAYSGFHWSESVIDRYTAAWDEAGGGDVVELSSATVAQYLAQSMRPVRSPRDDEELAA